MEVQTYVCICTFDLKSNTLTTPCTILVKLERNLHEKKTTIMKHFSYILQLQMAELGMDVDSADEGFTHMLCSMYIVADPHFHAG